MAHDRNSGVLLQTGLGGLSSDEAERRLTEYGPNALPDAAPPGFWRRLLEKFTSPLVYILLAALVIDLAAWLIDGVDGLPFDAVIIAAVLIVNALVGMWQERRAEDALGELKRLALPQAWVVRDGALARIPSSNLVPGDAVRLDAGDRVPADGRVAQGQDLMVDESALTGESVPVDKVNGDIVFSGTLIVRGAGYAGVTETGAQSAMGRIATMLAAVVTEAPPFERRLREFGNRVARVVLAVAALLVVGGILALGPDQAIPVFLLAVATVVAAVPESLPAIVTLTLALGVERMARRNAVVRRLAAVEALGSVTLIVTDKTGTITENAMQVRGVDSRDPEQALKAMVLANDAKPGVPLGDPMDLALLDYATDQGVDVSAYRAVHPRVGSRAFDAAWKFTRATVSTPDGPVSYFKGAPEVILERSSLVPKEKKQWMELLGRHAADGFRTLALAVSMGEREDRLTFLGMARFWDPPRPDVAPAIRKVQEAGIRVVMLTGDHPATALAIARQVGIASDGVVQGEEVRRKTPEELASLVKRSSVFARVRPEDKLALVNALKAQGEIVAMTGDGVNDTPALKRADVAVAMGQRGAAVAREVSDLVLLDDSFNTIVAAVEDGRSIYENIQKFIRYMFATNLAEVLVVLLGTIGAGFLGMRDAGGGLLLPLTAAQILWINLITDSLPALALAVDRNPGVMQHPPRDPGAPLLDRVSLQFVLAGSVIMASVTLGTLGGLLAWGHAAGVARTASFMVLVLVQLPFALAARRAGGGAPPANPYLLGALTLTAGLQFLALYTAPLQAALGLEPLPVAVLGWVILATFLAWGGIEVVMRGIRSRR